MSTTPPTITSLTVVGNYATVNFSDPSASDYQFYVATLTSTTIQALTWNFPNVPASGPLVAQVNLLELYPPLDPNQQYQVVVAGSPGGLASAPSALPTSSPAVATVTVSATAITVTWTDAYPPNGVATYTATLWQGTSQGYNFPDVGAGMPMTATMTLPAGLSTNLAYTVNVTSYTASGQVATGPQAAVILATTSCTTSLTGDGKTLAISAPIAPAPPPWNAFSFQLLDGDTVIATQAGVAPASSMPWVLANPLQAGRSYAVSVAGQLGTVVGVNPVSLGPFGPATPVIVGAPAIAGTPSYDGALLSVAWTRVADPAVIGYLVSVSGVDTLVFVTGIATTLSAPATLTGSDQVTVSAIGAASTGPAGSSAAISLPSAAPPIVLSAVTDGRILSVNWTPIATAGVIGYQVAVGTVAKFDTGNDTTLNVPVSFAWSTGLAVTVATLTASGPGTPSAPLSISVAAPTAAPTVTGALWDGTTLFIDWTPVAQFGVAGYAISVSGGGTTLQFSTGCNTVLAIPARLDPTKSWSAVVAAINAAGSAGPTGTLEVTLPAALAAPTVNVAGYDGAIVFFDWTAPAGTVLGYLLAVSDGTTTLAYSTGPETSLAMPAALDFTRSWSAIVTAVGVVGNGAASAPATVTARAITGAPAVTSVSYDGALLSVQWGAVLDPSVLGYRVAVAGTSVVVAGTSVALPVALDPTQSYTAAVTAVGAVAEGPAGAPATVVAVAPELSSVSYAAGTITAAWSVAAQPTGASYELALFEGGALVASTTSGTSVTGGTLAATLASGRSYTVRSRVTAGGSLGPWSGTGAILIAAPVILSSLFDGTTVAVAWTPLADPAITGYAAMLSEVGGSMVGAPAITGSASAVLPTAGVTPGKQYQVTVQAIGNAAVGPASAPAAAVIDSVTATGATWDGGLLTLTWNAATEENASYLVEVWQGDEAVAAQATSATTLVMPVVLGPTASYTATVRVIAGVASGAPGAPLSLISASTYLTQGTTDPMTGLTSFAWASLGTTSYLLQGYLGGLPYLDPQPVSGTQYTYPVALFRNSEFAVAVAGVTTSGSVSVTGPYGPRYYPPTIQPVIGTATFNGVTASVSWGFVDGSTSYRVSVLQGGQQQPVAQINVAPTINHVVFASPVTNPLQTYGAVVQSLIGTDTGPPSAQAPLFAPGFFVSTSPATTYAPFIYPATSLALIYSATLGQSGMTAVLYLPNLTDGPPITLPVSQGAFVLGLNTDPGTKAAFPYTLTIAGSSNAWSFSPSAIRTTLQSDYVAFLKQLESPGGASPGGVATVQQAISRYLPQTFQETLYYAYGWNGGAVDLRPGMILRVSTGDYTTVADQSISEWMDGYAGGPVIDYEIGSYLSGGAWMEGFDAFIAQLVAANVLQVGVPPASDPNVAGVADGADLFYPKFAKPFYRLFVPGTLQTPTGSGSVVPANNFAIAAAATYTLLDASSNVPSSSNPVAYFRGRAVVRPCIRVVVNGAEEIVPIGTTIGNLLDRYGWRPPSTAVALDGFVLERSLSAVVLSPGDTYHLGQSYPVRLDWRTLAIYAPWLDALALPLLHGDRLTVVA